MHDLIVVKADGRKEPFALEKIKKALMVALVKRPITLDDLDQISLKILSDTADLHLVIMVDLVFQILFSICLVVVCLEVWALEVWVAVWVLEVWVKEEIARRKGKHLEKHRKFLFVYQIITMVAH